MQLGLFGQGPQSQQINPLESGLKLTSRDQDIIEFLCEMHFASLDEIQKRFFKGTGGDDKEGRRRWAQRRLTQLREVGLLKSERNFQVGRSFYLPTVKGYLVCGHRAHSFALPRPVGSIDIRTFRHDWLLVKIREAFEAERGATQWLSDRVLMVNPEVTQGLPSDNIPDAIYSDSEGKRVAFELELTQKARTRYVQKVQRFIKWIRERRGQFGAVDRVHYLVSNSAAEKALRDLTKIHPNYFQIESLDLSRKGCGA